MHYSTIAVFLTTSFCAQVYAHGTVTQIQGANGVNMPGHSGTFVDIYVLNTSPDADISSHRRDSS
jgi:hypothetical protein